MPIYYVETSALFKRYRTERGYELMAELLSGRRGNELFVTSHLTTVEMEAATQGIAMRAAVWLKSGRSGALRRWCDVEAVIERSHDLRDKRLRPGGCCRSGEVPASQPRAG